MSMLRSWKIFTSYEICLYIVFDLFATVLRRRALRRVARFFGAGKEVPNIKELGLYAILSYGFVSNASYATCVGLAWFAASKKTGATFLLLLQLPSSML